MSGSGAAIACVVRDARGSVFDNASVVDCVGKGDPPWEILYSYRRQFNRNKKLILQCLCSI